MKKISELSRQELADLFNSNKKLRLQVEENYIDNEYYYISDILSYVKKGLSDWSIGFYNYNTLTVGNVEKFLLGLESLQADYNIFTDSSRLEYILDRLNFLGYGIDLYTDNHDRLSAWLEKQADILAGELLGFFNDITKIKEEYLLEYFIEFYACERMDDFRIISDCIFEIGSTSDYITLDGQSFNKSSIQFNIA